MDIKILGVDMNMSTWSMSSVCIFDIVRVPLIFVLEANSIKINEDWYLIPEEEFLVDYSAIVHDSTMVSVMSFFNNLVLSFVGNDVL